MIALYRPLVSCKEDLGCIYGRWAENNQLKVIDCDAIHSLVGIWESPKSSANVYILRKHPVFGTLTDILHHDFSVTNADGGDGEAGAEGGEGT